MTQNLSPKLRSYPYTLRFFTIPLSVVHKPSIMCVWILWVNAKAIPSPLLAKRVLEPIAAISILAALSFGPFFVPVGNIVAEGKLNSVEGKSSEAKHCFHHFSSPVVVSVTPPGTVGTAVECYESRNNKRTNVDEVATKFPKRNIYIYI